MNKYNIFFFYHNDRVPEHPNQEPPPAAAPNNLQPPVNYGGARPKSKSSARTTLDTRRRHVRSDRGNRHWCKKSSKDVNTDKKPTVLTDEFSRIMSESLK